MRFMIVVFTLSGCFAKTTTTRSAGDELERARDMSYQGTLPVRPKTLLSAAEAQQGMELAEDAIESGMYTTVSVSDDGVRLSASPVYSHGYAGGYPVEQYNMYGLAYAEAEAVLTPDGYGVIPIRGRRPPLSRPVVVSVPQAVPQPVGQVSCPEEGTPAMGTAEFDACLHQSLMHVISEHAIK